MVHFEDRDKCNEYLLISVSSARYDFRKRLLKKSMCGFYGKRQMKCFGTQQSSYILMKTGLFWTSLVEGNQKLVVSLAAQSSDKTCAKKQLPFWYA